MPTSTQSSHSTSNDLDRDLMLQVCQGNHAAFESLVDRCQGGLIQYLTYTCKNAQLAEDLAQEVFVRLYRARAAYEARGNFKGYLYQIARNLWRDYLRRQKIRTVEVSLTDEGSYQVNPQTFTTQNPFADRQQLRWALEQLPEQQRDPLLLSHIEGMTYQEIATCLQVPIGTIKSRIFHATRKLRDLLQRR